MLSFGRILSVDDIDVPFVEVVEDISSYHIWWSIWSSSRSLRSLEAVAKLKNSNKLEKKGQLWKKETKVGMERQMWTVVSILFRASPHCAALPNVEDYFWHEFRLIKMFYHVCLAWISTDLNKTCFPPNTLLPSLVQLLLWFFLFQGETNTIFDIMDGERHTWSQFFFIAV